ncbi:LacI family transcriptional regulator [Bifidobacterium dolichotidis]|uniref:LacI family transcriptional regulator n=1 Tax=Bifidobacterium dolichotidis TaxID=2306976 RepID=A0A430FQV1_9BIFI|nr:LacI family DNA-binding transcriptional regulator [Bifidobacterium dolichotidis]RSX55200.1 LacI family transcriptional regulator [Bifidobacterium dolichotidis]
MTIQHDKVTIFDVAKTAGVSSSAVSYALNGKSGVSEVTRAKVLKVAQELGWKPNRAAQSLAQAKSRRVGLIMNRDPNLFSVEPSMMGMLSGFGSELERNDYSMLLRLAGSSTEELSIIRDWTATGNVDALLLLHLEIDDPRVDLLTKLSTMPALAIGDPTLAPELPTLHSDMWSAAERAISHLRRYGHRKIARVAGPEEIGQSHVRNTAFLQAAGQQGVQYQFVHTDYTADGAVEATRALLNAEEKPTAIIYDNDVMAMSGLSCAQQDGVVVPRDLSIMAMEDSFVCHIMSPHITAMSRNVTEAGRMAANIMLRLVEGEHIGAVSEPPYELIERESTGTVPSTNA